jgi:chromosome segregation ATPase
MREVAREKRQEVVQHYLLGSSYEEIVKETGVSHGTMANIIREVENGQLSIAGSTSDRINDLRQLALDLRKKNLEPSQALLVLALFERLRTLGISPDLIDKCADLIGTFAPADFPVKDFFGAAFRLRELEQSENKPFDDLTEEYNRMKEAVPNLRKEVEALRDSKSQLSKQTGALGTQLTAMPGGKKKLDNEVEVQTIKIKELKSRTKEVEEERARLNKGVQALHTRRVGLSAEVDGKEESLRRLNEIGLVDEDLLRLKAFLEKMSENEDADTERVKQRFFLLLSLFREVSDIERTRETEAEKVKALVKEKSVLEGQILGLEKVKGKLEGEISSCALFTSQKIQEIGLQACQQIQQQSIDIREQFSELISDVLKTGESVGQMSEAVKRGEKAQKGMEDFIGETRRRLEAS